MRNVIYSLVAPSGAGKSTLIQELLRAFPEDLGAVRSTTTRPRRTGPEDDIFYHFVEMEEFARRLEDGLFVQHVLYGGNRYGTDRRDIEGVFITGRQGICAMTEQGVKNVRAAGYEVVAVRVVPTGPYKGRDEARAKDDAVRAKLDFLPDMEFENSFEKGGVEDSISILSAFIGGHIKGLKKRDAAP